MVDDFVVCKICGKKLKRINSHHLSKHNISFGSYKQRYPKAETISPSLSHSISNRQRGDNNPNSNRKEPISKEIVNNITIFTLQDGRKYKEIPFKSGKRKGYINRDYGVIKKCLLCKSPFFASNTKIKQGKGKYCCKYCRDNSSVGHITNTRFINGNTVYFLNDGRVFINVDILNGKDKGRVIRRYGVLKECLICGIEFFASNMDIKRGSGLCCSVKCATEWRSVQYSGANSWMWKGGISFEKYTIEFNERLKRKIRERDNYTCQICGIHENELNQSLCVHHIDYNKYNSSPDNLISLCGSCHGITNFNRDYWTKYFMEDFKNDTPIIC